MKNVLKLIGAFLKLAFWVALLVGCVFLIKTGLDMMPGNGDVFSKLGLSDLVGSEVAAADLSVTYDEIYAAFESNELLADDLYGGNRYRITATIKRIDGDSLFNMAGCATLSLRVEVGDMTVSVLAEFEEDQEDVLKKVAVGDTIVFDGTCVSATAWMDCKIVEGE